MLALQRIEAITRTLETGLERLFRQGKLGQRKVVHCHSFCTPGLLENDVDILRQCLRTYSLIDKVADAETLFRDIIVKPFANEV